MANSPEVRIRVLWDSIAATRGMLDTARTSGQTQKQIAADARISTQATLTQARAVATLEQASLAASRAQLANVQATVNVAKAARIAADATAIQAKATAAQVKADEAAALAAERRSRAETAATTRARVTAENRQWRDEGFDIRQRQGVTQSRRQIASGAADAGVVVGGGLALGLGATFAPMSGFDQDLRNVNSLSKVSEAEFRKLHDAVLALANDPLIKQMPDDLAKGLYDIVSSGKSGKDALDILRLSAIGASAGMTDTATSSRGLLAVLNSGVGGVTSASQAMDVLFQTVDDGVVTFPELASSIGMVLPLAASAGISLQELSSAIVVMTKGGLSGAQSIEYLNQYIQQMLKPSSDAAKQMDALGIQYGMAHLKAVGLSGSIEEVTRKTTGHQDSLAKLFPNLQSFIAFLSTSKNAGADMTAEMRNMTHASDGLGAAQSAAAEQAKGAAFQADKVKQQYETLAITVGEKLLPIFREVGKVATSVADAFNKLTPGEQEAVVISLAYAAALLLIVSGAAKAYLTIIALKEAFAAAQLAEGAAAAEGAGLFAAAGPWGLAIAAAIVLIGGMVIAWNGVREAQDQAAQSAKAYADKLKTIGSTGELGKLTVNQTEIAHQRDLLKDQITAQKELRAQIAVFQKKGDNLNASNLSGELNANPGKYGDASPGGLERMQATLKKYDADYKTESARITQLVKEGQGARAGGAARTGADGFALAVSRIDPNSIVTDKIGQTCANFVSKVFQQAGLAIPTINGAKALRDEVIKRGGQSHDGPALPGDLVVYHGGRFGTRAGGGYHVGYADGEGGDWESSRGKTKHENIAGNLKWGGAGATVEFITVPGSTFTNAGAAKGGATINHGAAGGAGGAGGSDTNAKDKAAALLERAGLTADDAKRSYEAAEKAFEETKNIRYLVSAENLRRTQAQREIEEARAGLTQQNASQGGPDPAERQSGRGHRCQRSQVRTSQERHPRRFREGHSDTGRAGQRVACRPSQGGLRTGDRRSPKAGSVRRGCGQPLGGSGTSQQRPEDDRRPGRHVPRSGSG